MDDSPGGDTYGASSSFSKDSKYARNDCGETERCDTWRHHTCCECVIDSDSIVGGKNAVCNTSKIVHARDDMMTSEREHGKRWKSETCVS